MRKLLTTALVTLLAVVMLGAGAPDATQRYNRIGHNLMCVCSCGQVLVECNHVGCPDSRRMIGELNDNLAGPNSDGADSLILNWFVNKYGATVLAAPIRGGFDTVAWIIPIALFILATIGTAFVVRHWGRRNQPAFAAASIPTQSSDPIRDRIRRDTEF